MARICRRRRETMRWPKLRELGEALLALLQGPYTTKFPAQPAPAPTYRGAPRYYEDLCIACGTCARVCPANAITLEELGERDGAKWRRLRVDYGRCIFCGTCEANCPVNPKAIRLSNEYNLAYVGDEDHYSISEVPIGGKKVLKK
jgi:formate hydrogenlyase subunit 6/NADH:ubiquinone oxidoreductase subunit I